MNKLVAFGPNLVDPSLVASVKISTERHATPAPGQERREGEYGFQNMWVAEAYLDFHFATPKYVSFGYETPEGACAAARDLAAAVEATGHSFLTIGPDGEPKAWARLDLIGGVTRDNRSKVNVWLNCKASSACVSFESAGDPDILGSLAARMS